MRAEEAEKEAEGEEGRECVPLCCARYSQSKQRFLWKGRCILASSHEGFKLASDCFQSDGGFPCFCSIALSFHVKLDFVVSAEEEAHRKRTEGDLPPTSFIPNSLTDGTGTMIFDSVPAFGP